MIKLIIGIFMIFTDMTFGICKNNIDLDGHRLIHLGTPTNPSDASTKAYCDEGDTLTKVYADTKIQFKKSSDNTSAVYESGNVGIGILEPKTSLHIVATDAIIVPVGTTSERPATPVAGMIRMNAEIGKIEGYTGSEWVSFGN